MDNNLTDVSPDNESGTECVFERDIDPIMCMDGHALENVTAEEPVTAEDHPIMIDYPELPVESSADTNINSKAHGDGLDSNNVSSDNQKQDARINIIIDVPDPDLSHISNNILAQQIDKEFTNVPPRK